MERDIEQLLKVQELLKKEKEEDYRIYNEQVLKSSLTYRKNTGLSWYPVVINNTEIGLGEYLVLEVERKSNLDESHQFTSGKSVTLFSNKDGNERSHTLNGVIKFIHARETRHRIRRVRPDVRCAAA